MRRYETIVIVDPDITEEDRTSLLTRVQEIIPQQEGVFIQDEHWGTKKLAYEIRKKPRGYYVRLDYCGTGKVVDEIERFFRIDDRVMKYLTVQLDPKADAEKILADMAAAKTEAQSEAATEAEATTETEPAAEEATAEAQAQPALEKKADEPTPEN